MEPSKRPVSRRRKADGEAAKKNPASKVSIGIQIGAVAVVFLLVFVATRNGGAPQALDYPAGGADTELKAWRHVATYPDGRTETLCALGTDCGKEILKAALDAGAVCSFEVTAWLGSPDNPVWVHSVRARHLSLFHSGDFSRNETNVLNSTLVQRNGTVAWEGGLWWRGERERATVLIGDVPCDTWNANVDIYMTGKAWTGKAFRSTQHVKVILHRDILPTGNGNRTATAG